MKHILYIAALATSIMLASCTGNKTENHGEETEHHDEHENSSTATLTEEQIKSIGIEYGSIEKKQLTATLKLNGLLRVPNNNQASVTSLFGGVVSILPIQQGNTVIKGQVLATLSNTNFITMQEEFLTISSKLILAEIEYNRQKELQQGNATSVKKLQEAESELNALKAQRASLKKQLELLGINSATLTSENIQSVISVKSPINGIISNIYVNLGSYVDANKPIADIVDNSQLHLDLYVYEKDLPKLKVGQIIHFTLTNNPGKEYDAEVYAVSNTFEPNTKTVAVHANVKGDKQGLIDGMSITALVSLENATVDAVPTNAIVNHEGQDYIFIVTDAHTEEEHHEHGEALEEHKHDEHGHKHEEEQAEHEHQEEGITFEKIPIRKGTTDVGYSEITLLKEIPANSKVVVNGAFFIMAKMTNQGEGHEH
ncbi:MAG: efflux RND transporter periplasmic adaptor subunit [Saprospiraceae bacterium]|jgi:RND family efflux transporter MFP subunit|nr:efflux RND transporter periplasmic adaptor subunit [Saprospiraceae bacterium]MCZ2129124.1 efflux RND transporter periplasmic adaptor subunit [Bacteroidia bacterium]TNE73257.1 MAG: efflux RND transporter periplasmic adaptor subunit [bacterium]